jgi:putative serine protease PepD
MPYRQRNHRKERVNPSPRTPTLPRIAALVLALGLAGGGGALVYAASSSHGSKTIVRQVTVGDAQPAASTSGLSVNAIYRRASRGVVEITVTTASADSPFNPGGQVQRAQGSGWVYDSRGDIVTNEHVVDGAQSVSVKFSNGASYNAHVVGSDTSTDLAVVKVDAPSSLLAPLRTGDSSKLQVGDGVVAIGSPFGLEETVTSGIVSALHRQMTSPNHFAIADSIQTDAAINHGNSGGPLLNMRAEVVGVTAQIQSDSGGNEGVGFAIPSTTVRSIVSQLLASGKAEHAYLGVGAETIPAEAADALKLVAGAAVTDVKKGTPAAKAGLRAATGTKTVQGQDYPTGGDVITAIDGNPIATREELQSAIDGKRPGDTISLRFSRAGHSRTASVKLGTRPS